MLLIARGETVWPIWSMVMHFSILPVVRSGPLTLRNADPYWKLQTCIDHESNWLTYLEGRSPYGGLAGLQVP